MFSRHCCSWLSLLLSSGCDNRPSVSQVVPPNLLQKLAVRQVSRDDSIIPGHLVSAAGRRGKDAELPQDTITKRGNFVRYLLTEDSCCADNVYIRWGNAGFSCTYIARGVRDYRSYFTPHLKHETKDYLILWHGCATGCQALLFLPLNKQEKLLDVEDVVGYDPQSYTVVHGFPNPDQETDFEFLQAVNAKTRKTKRVVFRHMGRMAQRSQSVDSCRVDRQKIRINATLLQDEKEVAEELILPNDIQ